MKRFLVTISYDGSNYAGFQRQQDVVGVQEVIEKAFKNMTQIETKIHSAGRTDRGVHALGQTFHFDTNLPITPQTWKKGLNFRLPLDVRVKSVKKVSTDFHARYSAKARVYEYKISKRPSNVFTKNYEVYIPNFDFEIAQQTIPYFLGTKDFKGFSKYVEGKNTIRTIIDFNARETSTHYIFTITGISFLKYMVRSIMGTIIEISTGKKKIEIINEIFETSNRKLVGKTAEARGLFLKKVIY